MRVGDGRAGGPRVWLAAVGAADLAGGPEEGRVFALPVFEVEQEEQVGVGAVLVLGVDADLGGVLP